MMVYDRDGVLSIIKENENISFETLVNKVVEKFGGDERKVKNLIITMRDDGIISLCNPEKYVSFRNFLLDIDSTWFYLVVFSIILYNFVTITSAIYTELFFFRIIFGGLFSFYIPGYVSVRALYANLGIDGLERVAISIGLSLIITPLTGFVLNYTAWGINLISLSISLSLLSLFIAVIAMYRYFIVMSNQAEI